MRKTTYGKIKIKGAGIKKNLAVLNGKGTWLEYDLEC